MKSVLISIQPKWCELIASSKKTVEVRKTKPKIETPFKCYIYCTHNNRKYALHTYINSGYGRKNFGVIGNWRSGKDVVDVNSHLPAYRYNAYLAEGKVIGEFVCDKVTEIKSDAVYSKVFGGFDVRFNFDKYAACLTEEQIFEYLGEGKGYAWHISDLVIYDKPKELSEFYRECEYEKDCGSCPHLYVENTPNCYETWCELDGKIPISRPPQSWCYVEEWGE